MAEDAGATWERITANRASASRARIIRHIQEDLPVSTAHDHHEPEVRLFRRHDVKPYSLELWVRKSRFRLFSRHAQVLVT